MISSLRLRNFRSYADETFEFNPAVTIIVGPNGSGKTNLLEGILVVARGGSYRAKDADLVSFNKPWARLDAQGGEDRTVKLTPSEATKKLFEISDKTYKRLPGRLSLPVVLFEPGHLRMLSGSPEGRRSYMDELLCQTSTEYAGNLRRYKQVLAQRNALLKQPAATIEQQMFAWNIKLAQLAGKLVQARLELVDTIQESIAPLYKKLSKSKAIVAVAYDSKCDVKQYESSLLRRLESQAELDRLRGFTGSGPHRDDLAVTINEKPLSISASRGESRTIVLAMKIIELQLIEAARQAKPILLLDDVFSELDGARRHALTSYLADYQTVITTTDADIALSSFNQDCTVIPLDRSQS